MTVTQAFFAGAMTAWFPALVALFGLLWQAPEIPEED